MRKFFIFIFIFISIFISMTLIGCNISNEVGQKALPQVPCHIKVYNGGALVLDMDNAVLSSRKVRNERLLHNGENWLIYSLCGVDIKTGTQHVYNFCDSKALMIIWE